MSIIILGAGGHAKVLKGILDWDWGLAHDPVIAIGAGVEVPEPNEGIVIGVGDMGKRKRLFKLYAGKVIEAISPEAVLSDLKYSAGIQVMAGVIVQPGCSIGENTLINTGAQIDHDCKIGKHCHIAPGVILCGNVTVGDETFIGAGSVITEGVTIPSGVFVPAGSLISKNGYCKRYVHS